MINIFKQSEKIIKTLSNPNRNYWESNDISWNREAIGPDGNYYSEEELFEQIRESDRQRLLFFS